MILTLRTKLTLIFSLICLSISAQDDVEYYDVGNISASIYQPLPFGDNFVNRGLSANLGGQLESKFFIDGDFFAGLRITVFGADVEDVTQTGNFQHTTISSFGVVGGYKWAVLPKLEFLFNGEVGLVGYNSELNGFENFSDSGYTLRVTPELHYRVTNGLGLFLAPEFRYDRLNIKTAEAFEGYFNNITYATFSFGLRFTFRNDKPVKNPNQN